MKSMVMRSSASATGSTRMAAPRTRGQPLRRPFQHTPACPHSLRVRPLRFKEGDDQEEMLRRRAAEEGVRRAQEKELAQERELRERIKEVKDTFKEGTPSSLSDVTRAVQDAKPGYSDEAPRVSPLVPAFTRRREIFVGRIAMVGFFAAAAWEVFLPFHPGPIGQVAYFTGLAPATVATGLMGLILYNTVGGLAPWSPTFSLENLRDVSKRPAGPPSTLVNPLNIKAFLGISDWGFTKRNELFHGRLAMLGFLAALIQEIRLGGPGPLAQVAYYLGTPADDSFYSAVPTAFLGFVVFAVTLAALRGNFGFQPRASEDEIY